MSMTALATALRAKAASLQKQADKRIDEIGRVDPDEADTIELIRVLARAVEGKPVLKAFGAPGDWSGDIETALRAAHSG